MRFSSLAFAGLLACSSSLVAIHAHADEPTPPPYGPPTAGSVQVDVTTTPDVKGRADLFALGDDDRFGWICSLPCNTILPAHTPIAVRLEKSDDPAHATLERKLGSSVDIRVSPPSTALKTGGYVTLGVGLATITAAIITVAVFASMPEKESRSDSPVVFTPAAMGVLIGVPVGLLGVILSGIGGGMVAAASDAPSLKVTAK